jgi:hypothetical protein
MLKRPSQVLKTWQSAINLKNLNIFGSSKLAHTARPKICSYKVWRQFYHQANMPRAFEPSSQYIFTTAIYINM